MIQRVEKVLSNKRSAEYVKNLATNTVPKQTYLYQRYIEDSIARANASTNKRNASEPATGKSGAGDHHESSAALLRRVHREASNLDIEFAEIDEVRAMDEASPLLALKGGKERHNSVYLGEDQRLNANLQQVVLEM